MSKRPNIKDTQETMTYQIRVKGHLGEDWTEWFCGLSLQPAENGETLLTCPALDQAALYGLLRKLRDLGLTLVSVNPLEPCPEPDPQSGSSPGEG